jgi:hypothetical protein
VGATSYDNLLLLPNNDNGLAARLGKTKPTRWEGSSPSLMLSDWLPGLPGLDDGSAGTEEKGLEHPTAPHQATSRRT